MKKFKYPLAISGTTKELKALIPSLENLGYEWNSNLDDHGPEFPYLSTTYSQYGKMGFFTRKTDDTIINSHNTELVLALAAMVDDKEFYGGEILDHVGISLYRYSEKNGRAWVEYLPKDSNYVGNVNYDYCDPEDNKKIKNGEWRKATKEEIIAHFTKNSGSVSINNTSANTASSSNYSVYTDTPIPSGSHKKIIGWNVKKGVNEEIAVKAVNCIGTKFIGSNNNSKVAFVVNSVCESNAKRNGVLELLFEPVYEEEKKYLKLSCGLLVNIEGGVAKVEGRTFHRSDLINLIERVYEFSNTKFKPTDFMVGCDLQYKVTREEIQAIINLL